MNRSAAEQSVAHGAAGRAGSEISVVHPGPVNGGRYTFDIPYMNETALR